MLPGPRRRRPYSWSVRDRHGVISGLRPGLRAPVEEDPRVPVRATQDLTGLMGFHPPMQRESLAR
ncbi:hypothetical protein GCM10022226_13920 [Sphaerisporangium flaviroseum]|uniref:Uncharacterized protein n=1 Tax=Sphaerisporangium flaviroseum TaxID=509199 RepID=A0ABP7HRK9_9ACTN